MAEWLLLALSLLLIVACGVFVAGEFALLTADRSTVERLAAEGDTAAKGVLKAFGRLSSELAGIQLAITVTNLVIGFLAEPAVARLLRPPLRSIGAGGATGALAVALALVVSTLLTMVFGELVPKNLAIAAPVATARAVQAPVRAFSRAMSLPIRVFDAAANRILILVDLQPQQELASARSPVELLSVVRHSQRVGTLPAGTAALLARSLTFDDKRARDVLTARPQMVTVEAGATIAAMLDTVRATGHSRLPVRAAGGADDVVGMIELDQAVAVPALRRRSTLVRDVMGPVVEVPETLELNGVLHTLQARRSQIAIVIDEYGGTAGLLTGEDLLEELVGEVEDEHDQPEVTVRFGALGFEVSGLLRPDEVTAATTMSLPSLGVYETVGGLVMHELGRLPVVGDIVQVENVSLTVLAMDGRRIDRVRVNRAETDTARVEDDVHPDGTP